MSLIDTIKDFFCKKKDSKDPSPQKKEDSTPKPMAADAFIDGNHGLIPGIKKNWVTGVIAVIGGIFVIAVFFAMTPDDETKKENSNTSLNLTKQVTDKKKSAFAADQVAKTPSDYEGAAQERAMKEKNDFLARQNGKATTPSIQQATTPPPAPAPVSSQVDPNALAALAKEAAAEKARLGSKIEMLKGNRNGYESNNGQSSADNSYSIGSGVSASQGQGQDVTSISLHYTAATANTIISGTIFPVMLLTGINTDSPGRVLAQVQADVYDFHRTRVIIPSGSKLLGAYAANSATNGRLSLIFTALQLPDGGTYDIGNSIIAMDGEGYMGVAGTTHRHTAQKIAGGVIGSAIAALGSIAAGNTSSDRENYTAGQLAAQGALGNLISSTSNMINGDANGIQPTVTVEPGHQFNVYVVNNMIFEQG